MNVVTSKAHFDGEKICLDEPIDLAVNTPLFVAVLSPDDPDEKSERADWVALAKRSLARAYGEDEPDYSADLIAGPSGSTAAKSR